MHILKSPVVPTDPGKGVEMLVEAVVALVVAVVALVVAVVALVVAVVVLVVAFKLVLDVEEVLGTVGTSAEAVGGEITVAPALLMAEKRGDDVLLRDAVTVDTVFLYQSQIY
jgi:hypothetical protein